MKNVITSIEHFLKGLGFYQGLLLTISVVIPLGVAYFLDVMPLGLPIVFGAFVNAPGDVPGSLKRKVNGILVSIGLTAAITAIVLFAKPYFFLLLVALAVFSFISAMIAVYGFRGSLIAFSGLLAMVLALAVNVTGVMPILQYVALMITGGLWYLLLSLLLRKFASKRSERQLLSDTLNLTGEYLKIRGDLLEKCDDNEDLFKKSLELQTKISENHETLRESLFTERKRSGRSHSGEKKVLIFISLVDILELALANTLDYSKINSLFGTQKKYLEVFRKVNVALGNHLKMLSKRIINNNKLPSFDNLSKAFENADNAIDKYVAEMGLPNAREGALTLQNLYNYQQHILEEIRAISRVIANVENASKISLKPAETKQFITLQEYSFNFFLGHFSFKSSIFRYALRLSVAVVFAYILGSFLDIKNTYWIILTLVVIMRPNYGLTKERSQNRIIGTVIGATVAVLIILITKNPVVYGGLSILSLMFAFSLIQQSYKVGAAFVTMQVVFIYSILQPNALEVVGYRVLDTIIGALLAVVANYLLWPLWEYRNLNEEILSSIKADINYLRTIKKLYNSEHVKEIDYRLPRKAAFLAKSDLNAAFQRMTQDPKSKQNEFQLIFEIVTINHTIVAALASLGNFLRKHKKLGFKDQFVVYVNYIENTLTTAANVLGKTKKLQTDKMEELASAHDTLLGNYVDISHQRNKEIKSGQMEIQPKMLSDLQEAHLLYNQLVWLKKLADDLKKIVIKYKKILG